MFYLMMHSTFLLMVMSFEIYGKEPDSERGNPPLPHNPLFLISSKCSILTPPMLHQLWSTGWNEK